MENKFNTIRVKKTKEQIKEEQHQQFKNQVKDIIEKNNFKTNSGLILFLIDTIKLIWKIFLFLLRVLLVAIILGIIVIIMIGLIYPESQLQLREIAIMVWNRLIEFVLFWVN